METIVLWQDVDGNVGVDMANVFSPSRRWRWWKLYEVAPEDVLSEDAFVHPGRNDWLRSRREIKVNWDKARLIAHSRDDHAPSASPYLLR